MKEMEKPAVLTAGLNSAGRKNQFIISGFRIKFLADGNTGKFCDYQFAGGVDDAARTKMTADGGEVLL